MNAELLLQNGANPNIVAEGDSNSLHYATKSMRGDVINLLIRYGVDVNKANN